MARPPDRGDAWGGIGTAWAVTGTLVAGMLVWGGLGYLVDRLAGTPRVFLAIGLIVGMAAGVYLVYLKYGRDDGAKS